MSPRRSSILMLLILVMALSPAVTTAAEEVRGEPPGLLLLEIDGLSEPMLRTAIDDGAMPFLGRLIDDGSHTLGSWRTTAATSTPVAQAGILHGGWQDIVGYRWWDRDLGRLTDAANPSDARRIEDSISGPDDLLADGGASIANMFSGGAAHVVLTGSHLAAWALMSDVLRLAVDPAAVRFVLASFLDGLWADLQRSARGEAPPVWGEAKRKIPVPILGPALEGALTDVVAVAVIRELQRGTPIMYASFPTYDEVGHYAGPDHSAAIDALAHIDSVLSVIETAAARAPRHYYVVVLADHGQTRGVSFERRHGETLTDVVRALMSDTPEPAIDRVLPDLVVAPTGNLAHVYFPRQRQRYGAHEIEARHPGLMAGLAAHPGIGIVVVQTGEGSLLALGPDGSRELATGRIDGLDPLGHYGLSAAESLANIAGSPQAGDLVVISTYDPVAEEVTTFEPQIGAHGGIGGPQMLPFLLYPTELEPAGEPLALHGLDELRAKFREWSDVNAADGPLDAWPLPAPSAHLGEQVCVEAGVTGASGQLCAQRHRFGAQWTVALTDEADDDRKVSATVSLDVAGAPDPSRTLTNDDGVSDTLEVADLFSPRVGTAIGEISIETCVVNRFGPDRCDASSTSLPRIARQGTPAHLARLRSLAFDQPLDSFISTRNQAVRSGVDVDLDWQSNGCSAGELTGFFDDRLEDACLRHDFAYRNFGNLFYDATDSVRRMADEQLAEDATTMGQDDLAPGLLTGLQWFGGPAFFGTELEDLWALPGLRAMLDRR